MRTLGVLFCLLAQSPVHAQTNGAGDASTARPQTLVAKLCTTTPGHGPEMVVVEAGRFQMGSPQSDTARETDESQHPVTIVQPFALARCETTVGQFREFVEDTGYVTTVEAPDSKGCFVWNAEKKQFEQQIGRTWKDPGFPQSDDHPVVCLAWRDAQAYAEWLAVRTGVAYRLPSEAEWEYATRAGATAYASYYWGDDIEFCDFANGYDKAAEQVIGETSEVVCRDRYDYTAPAGSYRRNAWGFSDLSGNVWEWVQDCYQDSYAGAPVDGSARDEETCDLRVVRGGGWYNFPRILRSADRFWVSPDGASSSVVGFRVARAL